MSTILNLLQSTTYQKKSVLEKIICHRLGISKTELFAHSEQEVAEHDAKRIHDAYSSYIDEHKPLEYVIGHVEFAGLKFVVNKSTLIPRPETEYMIDAVREYLSWVYESGAMCNTWSETENTQHKTKDTKLTTLLDIGTGCWVLGTSILHHCGIYISQAVLADLSPDALEVAQKNYESHIWTSRTGQDKLVISNLLDHADIYSILQSDTQDSIIVANLPYIPDELFDKNADPTVHDREPRMAFVWGNDGLDLYRVMFGQLNKVKSALVKGDTEEFAQYKVIFFLEMMTRQVDILRKEYPNRVFEEIKTFHFNIRIVRVIVE